VNGFAINMNNLNPSMKTNIFRTLDLIEAANFLGAHKETVRRLVAKREIPGVKVGRSWRFIEEDLVNYMRNKYSTPDALQGVTVRRTKSWHFTKEKGSGLLTSVSKENAYVKALGLK
jgi:excisionase family DNA binding protein